MKIEITTKDGKVITSGEFDGTYTVSAKLAKKAKGYFTAKFSIPIKDMMGYFHAGCYRSPVPRLDWNIDFSSSSTLNSPIITFFSQGGENRFTLYTDNLVDDNILTAKMNQQTGMYDIVWNYSVPEKARDITFYCDTKGGAWTQVFERARKVLLPKGLPYFPQAAWKPVYCTWYAAFGALTNEFLDANAKMAAKLGCGTFIVDDGWSYDESKRACPENAPTWYDDIGDWEVSEKKLPDFKKHIEYAQSLGLKYLLWTAPYFCYKNSNFYKSLPEEKRNTKLNRWLSLWDLRDDKLCDEVIDRFAALIRKYNLDGLKIDFLDSVDVDLDNSVGEALLNFTDKLSTAIRKTAGKDALIEFRQRYATLQMLNYATQFRAADVPFDYITNLTEIATMRVMLGDKVPIHADPVYWHPKENNVTVARHLIASLAGVPMVSMDLSKITLAHRKIIASYLKLYNDNIEVFSKG